MVLVQWDIDISLVYTLYANLRTCQSSYAGPMRVNELEPRPQLEILTPKITHLDINHGLSSTNRYVFHLQA